MFAIMHKCTHDWKCDNIVTAIVSVNEKAPVIDIEVTNQTLNEGDTAFFTCQATGQPIPTIGWYFNGASLQYTNSLRLIISEISLNSTIKYSALTIIDVKLSDIGTYTCSAANIVSSNISTGMLAVNGECDGQPMQPLFIYLICLFLKSWGVKVVHM